MRRPTRSDLLGGLTFVALFLFAVVIYARTDPQIRRSNDSQYLGPVAIVAINLAWSHRTLGLVRTIAWAVAGGASAFLFVGSVTFVGTLIRPWAATQPWLDVAVVGSIVAAVAALVIANVVRQKTPRGRRIALAQGALLPLTVGGLWIVSQLGPWTAIGILLALGGPIGVYWLGKQQSREAETSTLGPTDGERAHP